MEKLVKGFLKFRTEVFGKKKELFTRLSKNQAPRALFITCSDSRSDPIPPSSHKPIPGSSLFSGMPATRRPSSIVCGHTDCGVMRALLHPEEVHDLPAVKEWVGQAETTRRLMREHYTDLKGSGRLIKTTQENVRSQLDHLRTHPSVAVLLRQKKVDLHGWVYSTSTGDVWVYDFMSERFISLLDKASHRLKATR